MHLVVSPGLQVHETFVGVYEAPSTKSSTMFEIAQDVITRFELPISGCCGSVLMVLLIWRAM